MKVFQTNDIYDYKANMAYSSKPTLQIFTLDFFLEKS